MTTGAAAAVDNKVRQVVSNIRNLPTPPIVFTQIQKVTNDPDASAIKVAAVLSEDPAMSVKVLKLTNSAFYGLSREVASVKQAVMIVGMEAIKNLVLSASILEMFKDMNIDSRYQERFWRHSLAVGSCCRVLGRRVHGKGFLDPDTAFSAGLLHDIGKMVISCYLTEEFSRFVEARKNDTSLTDFELEEQLLGFTHTQIGAFLATHWKLPQPLCNAIAFHHRPQTCKQQNPLVHITHLADYLAKKTFYDENERHLVGNIQDGVPGYLQLAEDDLADIDDALKAEYERSETFMSMLGMT
ncbi:MAG: HDOD domain-containing protein [Candidatus Zixiibacteriota bacterium]